MGWLTLFGLLTKIALAVAELIRDRNLIAAGEAIANVQNLREIDARVQKARAARRAAADRGMQDDDPYRRD